MISFSGVASNKIERITKIFFCGCIIDDCWSRCTFAVEQSVTVSGHNESFCQIAQRIVLSLEIFQPTSLKVFELNLTSCEW